MNLLYIAYSCDPYSGSEDKIGWNVPLESAKRNKVYVITKEEHRTSIERYFAENKLENISFYYVDIPLVYKRILKGFLYSGRLNIWNKRTFHIAREICRQNKIDIIHQITPIEFRAIGDYGKIENIKFVCGPLGGGEYVPKGLMGYAKRHIVIEVIRWMANRWYRFRLRRSGKLSQCDYVMFANKETKDFFLGDKKIKMKMAIVTEIGLGENELWGN